jgi:hypothetical protein
MNDSIQEAVGSAQRAGDPNGALLFLGITVLNEIKEQM